MIKNKYFYTLLLINWLMLSYNILVSHPANAEAFNVSASTNTPMPTDSRIKTFVYNPNEIFQVKFMVGYQSIIELQKDENVELISFGDAGPWTTRIIGRRIFLKVSDPGVKTNMTIITDRRTYLMEIMSNDEEDEIDDRITYILRFFYPDINVDVPPTTKRIAHITLNKRVYNLASARTASGLANNADITTADGLIANAGAMNTNYTYGGDGRGITPLAVFDDGTKTYFKFADNNKVVPLISALATNRDYTEIPLRVKKSGEYVYVETIEKQFTLRQGKELICIFNEQKEQQDKVVANADGKK